MVDIVYMVDMTSTTTVSGHGAIGATQEPAVGVAAIMSDSRVTFGVTAPASAATVAELEAIGVESLWAGGHIASRNPSPEAMIYLALLAANSTVPVGTATLLLPLYPPAIVAKQIADLDNASGGRVMLGVGVGGEYPQEFRAVQVPQSERGRRADEAITLIRRLWTGEEISHSGPFYPMNDVKVHPRPRQVGGPPILVSGRQEAAMRRAATVGDGWMPYLYSPRRYRASVARIREIAAAHGRDLGRFGWTLYIPVCVDSDAARARRAAAAFLGGTYQQDFEQMIGHVGAAGPTGFVAERLCEYVDAGARHFIFLMVGEPVTQARQLVEHVVPVLRAHADQA
jgi:alkanesulfonate monooxygenase SsuD/methylene tetrahydromethanopterin reductase-like flavin-dependent oxidoreductase (luciferase family)